MPVVPQPSSFNYFQPVPPQLYQQQGVYFRPPSYQPYPYYLTSSQPLPASQSSNINSQPSSEEIQNSNVNPRKQKKGKRVAASHSQKGASVDDKELAEEDVEDKSVASYRPWRKKDENEQSDYEKLADFLMLDNGQNLRDFKGSGEDNKTSGVSKSRVANKCLQYFRERGITSRTAEQLRKGIEKLLGPMYREANKMLNKTGAGSLSNDPEELQKSVEKECPGFFSFREILGDTGKDSGGATGDNEQ
ncbi:hypothetical protein MBANPS3_012645, partial [Mucor bainieri]